jgi:hypothetical protein
MKESKTALLAGGLQAGESDMYDEDEIWSRFSGDKPDIGRALMAVLRNLDHTLPLSRKLRCLSIGSGSEPQFRILQAACRGGLFLLDIDQVPLNAVIERVRRQGLTGVKTIRGDYNRLLLDPPRARRFREGRLAGNRLDLITLHHSLYYSATKDWERLFAGLVRSILARRGAIHAVMMSARSRDPRSTTWLYNHFAGKYFGCRNDQDLLAFGEALRKNRTLNKYRIVTRSSEVRFWVDDFGKFMAVVWMILLYPNVHRYNRGQREEITGYFYREFWKKKQPLVQHQDHLVLYRGLQPPGIAP